MEGASSHTPEALVNALAALRPYTSGRLIVLFGAGGDRDPGKRVREVRLLDGRKIRGKDVYSVAVPDVLTRGSDAIAPAPSEGSSGPPGVDVLPAHRRRSGLSLSNRNNSIRMRRNHPSQKLPSGTLP